MATKRAKTNGVGWDKMRRMSDCMYSSHAYETKASIGDLVCHAWDCYADLGNGVVIAYFLKANQFWVLFENLEAPRLIRCDKLVVLGKAKFVEDTE